MSETVEHKPFVPADAKLPELTLLPLAMGTALGILFGAASLYVALKTGLTTSASIPIAVMSISIFKAISRAFGVRNATILENNMVQTAGSAGESIAFGVAATMPALMILGFDMDITRVLTVSVLGGLLGILMMIPLRRGMIVKEHGKLAYPEGTACAQVLIVGEQGGTNAKAVFGGFGLGFLMKLLNGDGGLKLIKGIPEKLLGFFKGGSVSCDCSPELLGVGYVIGPRIASVMCAGGVLAYLVLIPLIAIFGEHLPEPLFPSRTLRIADMTPDDIRDNYVLYIGAGAVATGGIISLISVLPMIASAFFAGIKSFGAKSTMQVRTDTDLSIWVVVGGCIALVVALMLLPALHVSFTAALLILAFGFLFVTVSSRLTGEIGSSSNPISGMTVATLLLTCLIFLAFNWTSPTDRVAALSIAAVVCIASSNGGTTSQDLKTGFLIGATPKYQQIGILVGTLISACVIGATLNLFNDVRTVYAKRDVPGVVIDSKLFEKKDTLHGPEQKQDSGTYNVVHITADNVPKDEQGNYRVETGRYLVDDAGAIRYLVDPGINGVVKHRDPTPEHPATAEHPEGMEVQKFSAPKARLMSLIIDGILTRKLPWGLVLVGVFIALTLEMSGISSLAFAVGVYLPLNASTPIWIGGIVRWLVERGGRKRTDIESESSPGVLVSSGLIAGGALCATVLALISGASEDFSASLNISRFVGAFGESDLVAISAFALIGVFVFYVGREKLLAGKK